ncbi:uncharacterized protein LOC144866426 [Branchiostoma floridae x Branchiostoma japonicum]
MAKCCSNCWYDRACWFFGLFTSIFGGISVFFGIGALMYWNNHDLIDEFAIPIWVGVFLICIGGLVMANNKCRRWEDINKEYLEELELKLISEEEPKPVKRMESFTRLFKSRSRLSIRSDVGKGKASQSVNQVSEKQIFERLDLLRKERENEAASRQGSPKSKSRHDKIRRQAKYELLNELGDQPLHLSSSWYSDLNCLTDEDMNKCQDNMRNKRFKPIPDHINHDRNDNGNEQLGNEHWSPDDRSSKRQERDRRRGEMGNRRHCDTVKVDEFKMLAMEQCSESAHSTYKSKQRRSRQKRKQGAEIEQEERYGDDEIPVETVSRRAERRPEFRRSFSEGHRETGSISDFNDQSENRLHDKRNSTASLGTGIVQHHTSGNFLEVPGRRRKKREKDLSTEIWQRDSRSLPGTPEGRRKAVREETDLPLYTKSLPGTPERRRRIPNPLGYHDRLDSTTINFYQKSSRIGEVKRKSPSQRSVNSMAEYQKRSLDKFMIPAFMEQQQGSTTEPDYYTTTSLDRKQHRARHRSQPLAMSENHGSSIDCMDGSRRRSIPGIIISQDALDGRSNPGDSIQNMNGSQQFASPNTYRRMAVRPKVSTRADYISLSLSTPTSRSPKQSPAQRRRKTEPALAGLESLKTYRDSFEADGYTSAELEADIYDHMVRERMRKFKGDTKEPKVIFPTRKRHRTAPAVSPATRRRYLDDMHQSPFFGLQDEEDDMDDAHAYSKFGSRKQSLPPYLDRRQRRTSGKHRKPSIPYLESYSSESEEGEEASLLGSRVTLNSRGGKNSRTVSPSDSLEGILRRTGSPPEFKMAARNKKAKHHGKHFDAGLIVPEPRKKKVRSPKLVSDMYETSGQENSATESETFPPTTWETEYSTGKKNNDFPKSVYSEEDEIRLLYNSNNEDAPYVKNNDGKVGNSRAHVLLNDDKEGVMVVVVKKRDTL